MGAASSQGEGPCSLLLIHLTTPWTPLVGPGTTGQDADPELGASFLYSSVRRTRAPLLGEGSYHHRR